MTTSPITPFRLARLLGTIVDFGNPMILATCPDPSGPILDEIVEEIQAQLGTSPSKICVVDCSDLLAQLRENAATITLVSGLDDWPVEQFRFLDINRSRLETRKAILFIVLPTTGTMLLRTAPNLSSYLGPVLELQPDQVYMSEKEVEDRLVELRQYYERTDREIQAAAESGALEADPDFAEWLVLMGRGDLV